jgi:hypothetical protein
MIKFGDEARAWSMRKLHSKTTRLYTLARCSDGKKLTVTGETTKEEISEFSDGTQYMQTFYNQCSEDGKPYANGNFEIINDDEVEE